MRPFKRDFRFWEEPNVARTGEYEGRDEGCCIANFVPETAVQIQQY